MDNQNIDNTFWKYKSFSWSPDYIEPSAWIQHIPFAFWLLENFKPNSIVELGVYNGTSYFSFCQAIERLNLKTAAYGVDTWQGDEHAGFYSEEVYNRVQNYNESNYSRFSTLIRSTFDEANKYFINESIDLLHIDGLHTYEAVKHDFETWLPLLSKNAIVLFHDINVRERDFGVFRYWQELKEKYNHFEFDFGFGLGVIAIGNEYSPVLQSLFKENKSSEYYISLTSLFAARGNSFKKRLDFEFLKNETDDLKSSTGILKSENAGLEEQIRNLKIDLNSKSEQLEESNFLIAEKEKFVDANNALQGQLAAINRKTIELEELNDKLRRNAQNDRGLIEDLLNKTKKLSVDILELEEQKAQLADSRHQLEMQKNALQLNSEVLLKENLQLQNHLEACYVSIEELKKKILLSAKPANRPGATTKFLNPIANRYPRFLNLLKSELIRIKWTLQGKKEANIYKLKFWKSNPHVPYELIDDYIEIENSELFDKNWYLSKYEDVRSENADPILHYILHGFYEGRDPGPLFSTLKYLDNYEDIRKEKANALLHYLYHGKSEGRKIFPVEGSEKSNKFPYPSAVSDFIIPVTKKNDSYVPEPTQSESIPEKIRQSDFLIKPKQKRIERKIREIKSVAFIAQPEYFDFHYREILEDKYSVKYFQNSFSEDPDFFKDLINFDADINIFFRGELVPVEVLNNLSGIRINFSSEPFPKIINRSVVYTEDSLNRFKFFLRIFERPYDYIFHYDEISKTFFENQGIQLSGYFPFPIATEIIKPADLEKKWDIFFSGRSTEHRDKYFGPLKRDFNFLHINHGVVGPDLLEFIHKCKIAVNVHAEDEISWEPRTQFLMSAGSLLISEPLSPTCPLRPGIDFIEAKDPWQMYEICQKVINNFNDFAHIAEGGRKRIEEVLSSKKNFPVFFDNVLNGMYEKASFNAKRLRLEPLSVNLKYNGFEHLLTELMHEHS